MITKLLPIIGARENSDAQAVMLLGISSFLELMTSNNGGDVVELQKILGNVRSEEISQSTLAFKNSILLNRIGPSKVVDDVSVFVRWAEAVNHTNSFKT